MRASKPFDFVAAFKVLMKEPFCFTAEQVSGMTLGEILFYNHVAEGDGDEGDDAAAVRKQIEGFWEGIAAKAKRLGMTPEEYWERERKRRERQGV